MKKAIIELDINSPNLKEVTDAINNKTAQKILNHLIAKEATTTELSDELSIPLNTTDYTIKKLKKAGIIEQSSHYWSKKGKKIPTYKITNKKIIISPTPWIRLRKYIIPTTIVTALGLLVKQLSANTSKIVYASVQQETINRVTDTTLISSQAAPSLTWICILIIGYFLIATVVIHEYIKNKQLKGGKE